MKLLPNSRDFSVKFNRSVDMGLETQKAFPFIYTLVSSQADQWTPQATDAATWGQPEGLANISFVGPTIAAAQTVEYPLRLDPDCNFKMLNIKYTAYAFSDRSPGTYNQYIWNYDYPGVANNMQMVEEESSINSFVVPLTSMLQVSLSFAGAGSKYIYGGENLDDIVNQRGSLLPIGLQMMQGYNYGFGQVRSPFLLPREGALVFKFTNLSGIRDRIGMNITVGAAIYGMKVRL